jgi:CRP-like cAMP-binding protein
MDQQQEIFTARFIAAIRDRKDEDYMFHVLRKLPEFKGRNDEELRGDSQLMAYEKFDVNTILFHIGDEASCWYYILRGSIMISGKFYPSGERFGHEDHHVRKNECLILDPTELLRVNYEHEDDLPCIVPSDDESLGDRLDPSPDSRMGSSPSLSGSVNSEDFLRHRRPSSHHVPRPFSDPSIPESVLKEAEEQSKSTLNIIRYSPYVNKKLRQKTLSSESLEKAFENPIQLERAPSPLVSNRMSDIRTSSVFDDDTTLSESYVDSDDDDQSEASENSNSGMDLLVEVLSKNPQARTDEDLDKIQEFANLLPALSMFTVNVRRSLLKAMVLKEQVEIEGKVIIKDAEKIDKWYIVLNGEVKWMRSNSMQTTYHVGESFGISGNLRSFHHSGVLVASKDCQYACVTLEDYSRVMTEGEESLRKLYSETTGDLEMILEKRMSQSRSQKREGYFVIEATPDRLLDHLLEETVDDNYHIDFLLTYRTFLPSPEPIVEKLLKAWNERVDLRKRVTHILLHWVGQHFADFDTGDESMSLFLDKFEEYFKDEDYQEAQRFIESSRSNLGKPRIVEIEREPSAGSKSSLGFEIDGYGPRGEMIFITDIDEDSQAMERGVRKGDELLAINEKERRNNDLENMKKALRNTYKLKLKVKSNVPEYRKFLQTPVAERRQRALTNPKLPIRSNIPQEMLEKRRSTGGLPSSTSLDAESVTSGKGGGQANFTDTMKRAVGKLKNKMGTLTKPPKKRAQRAGSSPIMSEMFSQPPSKDTEGTKKTSTANHNNLARSSSTGQMNFVGVGFPCDVVIKVYIPDHSHKYMAITEKTTIKELIHRAVPEFYPESGDPKGFVISMVTVQGSDAPIKNSVVSFNSSDLFNYVGLNSRFYLRPVTHLESLIQGEVAQQMVRESKMHRDLLNLDASEVAYVMTRKHSEVYLGIDPTEFIGHMFKLPGIATANLMRFERLTSLEPYWVMTTVVSEAGLDRRVKLIKKIIKIARQCRDIKNYNSAFALMSGLNAAVVQGLRSTWEKVPTKHKRIKEELEIFFDPSRNMARYRTVIKAASPPFVPLFPLIMKDLTFFHEGLKSKENGLINFEKLRLLAKEIRQAKGYCNKVIEVS